ncbi:MAG: nuclear transport factor 2 family protein [Pseudomonadota bacterium]
MSVPTIDFEPLAKPHWSDRDRRNAQAVIGFAQLIMNDHDFDAVLARFGGQRYRQHNRNIADGIEGVINTVRDLVARAPEFSYDVKHVHVDGEHVVLHSHATLKAAHRGDDRQGLNIMDTWRVVDGQLVEHWDAIQGIGFSMRLYSLLTGGKVRNGNGVF